MKTEAEIRQAITDLEQEVENSQQAIALAQRYPAGSHDELIFRHHNQIRTYSERIVAYKWVLGEEK